LLAPDLAAAALVALAVCAAVAPPDLVAVVFAAARADLAAVAFAAADLPPVDFAAVVLAVEEGAAVDLAVDEGEAVVLAVEEGLVEEGLAVDGVVVVVVDLAAGVAPVSSTLESTSSLGVGSTGGSPPAGGFLPVETTEGRRCSPPWVLMLMVPRHVGRSGGVLAGLIRRCLRAEPPALPQGVTRPDRPHMVPHRDQRVGSPPSHRVYPR
jgi:hypothetical protein